MAWPSGRKKKRESQAKVEVAAAHPVVNVQFSPTAVDQTHIPHQRIISHLFNHSVFCEEK